MTQVHMLITRPCSLVTVEHEHRALTIVCDNLNSGLIFYLITNVLLTLYFK